MPNETLLVQTLVDLADNLVDDFDIVDLLTLLSDRCIDVLGVASAGVMLAAPDGQLHVIASSSDVMRILELFEIQADEGPCLDCYRTGEAIVNVDLTAGGALWPHFTGQAIRGGFHSASSFPMHLRGRTIGALNMFRNDDGALGETDILAAQALADVATIAILQHQSAIDAKALNNQLTEALRSRIIIEQAKGKISEAASLDMNLAFQRLRHHARNHNLLLADLARDVVANAVSAHSLDALPNSQGL